MGFKYLTSALEVLESFAPMLPRCLFPRSWQARKLRRGFLPLPWRKPVTCLINPEPSTRTCVVSNPRSPSSDEPLQEEWLCLDEWLVLDVFSMRLVLVSELDN